MFGMQIGFMGRLRKRAGEPIDLFVVVGQSNAEGRGASASSPASPTGVYITTMGAISAPLADPVGGAITGSAWPAFANEWYAQTGKHAAFVESATGGTALLPDTAGTNWSPSGSLRAAAAAAANTAIAALASSNYNHTGNVYFLWAQGESEASTINGTTITGPLYEAALESLADYFKAQVPTMTTMGVIQTGGEADQTDGAGYAAIRLAQESACTDSGNLTMLYRGAFSYTARLMMYDNVHYNQTALNTVGKCAARALATGSAPIAVAPAVLAATPYADPSYTASVNRAANHTTASGTKSIVVAVSAMRPEDNTTYYLDAVKFGGVSLTRVNNEKASNNGGAPGRVNSSLWYLNESVYGASLSAVTENLSVEDAASILIIDWCALDLDVEVVPESYYWYTTVSSGTGGTVNLTTNAPGLIVGIGSSAASAAAPLTAALTNLSDVMDHGLGNGGGTRAGQMVVGHATETAAVTEKAYTATWSATCTAVAWVVAAFRKATSGEL